MAKTKKLCFMAVLTAIALTIFMIENQLPSPVPIPGIKLGLANIITLTAMAILGRKEAGAILAARIIMGAIFAGSPSTFIYSAAGGILAYIVMCVTIGLFKENQLWIVSALAAIAHNAGIFAYAPILAASGVITGVFTGFAAIYLIRAVKKLKL